MKCTKEKVLAYLLMLVAVVIGVKIKVPGRFEHIYEIALYLFIICFAYTVGKNDIKDRMNFIEGSQKQTFKIGLYLYLSFLLISALYRFTTNQADPEGLVDIKYTIASYAGFYSYLAILVAFGEEFFKYFIFVALNAIFSDKINKRYILPAIITSLIFGFMHVINHKITSGFYIAIPTLVDYVVLVEYKSLIPLIISHFLTDEIAFMGHTKGLEQVAAVVFLIVLGISMKFIICDIANFSKKFRSTDKTDIAA